MPADRAHRRRIARVLGYRGTREAAPSTCVQFKPRQAEFTLDDLPPGFRWFELYPDGHIVSAVGRAGARPRGVDLLSAGYS